MLTEKEIDSILVAMALPAANVYERDGHKQFYAHMRQAAWRRHALHSECASRRTLVTKSVS